MADSETPLTSDSETIVGAASFYDDPGETASGEQYDPKAFTAAAQLEIRDKFGGIKFGRLYRASFAVAEYGGKKLILKFNDVGPLRPGRKFDLSRAAMEYFDGLDKGVLPDFKVTVLPVGQTYTAGPVTDEELVAMGVGQGNFALASADPNGTRTAGAEQAQAETPDATVETVSAAALVMPTCVDLAPVCEDTGEAVAESEPRTFAHIKPFTTAPAPAPREADLASMRVATARIPGFDLDHWRSVELKPVSAGDRLAR
ncbi:MAG TPA: RlpA-like double-psi beta-barrel domain-containing protein [Xanthobacteraceae bacterium]|nr:RlpA-like double-psi beta-barrel domain-containing protein [Xanthobacteraceae bacterium]